MLQFKRGKAATGKASCFSRYLSPSSAEGVQHSTLFEQLSLSLFYLFGSGLSGLGIKPRFHVEIILSLISPKPGENFG